MRTMLAGRLHLRLRSSTPWCSPHWGAAHERVRLHIGQPGVGGLGSFDLATIRAQENAGRWLSEAQGLVPPGPPGVTRWALKPARPKTAWRGYRMTRLRSRHAGMMGGWAQKENRLVWFSKGMLDHHGGALIMAHDARAEHQSTILAFRSEVIIAQPG